MERHQRNPNNWRNNNCWLVVSTPLKNINQLGLFCPIYGKIIQMFQTTNQIGKSCLPQQLGTLGTTIGKSVHMKQAPQSHGFLAGMKSHFWWNCRFSTSGSHQIDSFWSVQCDWKPHGVLRGKKHGARFKLPFSTQLHVFTKIAVGKAITCWWFQNLWKIWKSVRMMKFPIYGKIENVLNHQPDNNKQSSKSPFFYRWYDYHSQSCLVSMTLFYLHWLQYFHWRFRRIATKKPRCV